MTQRPDATTAQDKGGGFEPHSEGQHAMLCVDVINLGAKIEQFGDFPAKEVEKVALVFVSGERNEDGSLRLVTVEVTNSMGEKANLRKLLESWRGKSYTEEQAKAGVPIHKLQSQVGLANIEHITTSKKRLFAKLISLTPLPKVMTPPSNDLLEEYVRPEFFDKRKEEYAKAVRAFRSDAFGDEPVYTDDDAPAEDDPDFLPF